MALDVVLLGFRNDIAKARVLEFLRRLPPGEGVPPLGRDVALPQRLYAGLDAASSERIRFQLESLGAQIALLPSGPRQPEPPPAAVTPASRSSSVRPFTLMLVLLLGAAVHLWRSADEPRRPSSPEVPAPPVLGSLPLSAGVDTPEAQRLNTVAIASADLGRFAEAVDQLEAALRLVPDHPVLTRNLQTVLYNWAMSELAANHLEDAGDHLRAAARLGERAEVLRALGVTYLRQGNYDHAGTTLEEALQLAPHEPATLLALADVYVSQDRRPEALDLLHRAQEAGAKGRELDRRVRQLGREVDAEWDFVQLRSPHFSVSFADDEDRGSVWLILDTLEEAYDTVGRLFDYHPDGRTAVVLYTQQEFHNITQTPDWAGGAFDGRIKIPVRGLTAEDPQLVRVLRHEYAHSVIGRLAGPRCPVWLNEGLAVWAEEHDEGERVPWARGKIAGRELFRLSSLAGSFVSFPADQIGVAYAQSYLAARALIDRYGARKVPALLEALNRTGDLQQAFAEVYSGDLAGFEQQLLRDLAG